MLAALALSLNAYSQFFDTVPYRGAFGVTGSTKPTTTAYNPDPTNTSADWSAGWSNWNPNGTTYPGDANWTPTAQHPALNANKVSVSGDISGNVTWTKNNWYEVSGTVHVLNGATLTIEPGTVIRGNANNVFVLIIAKGGKINAIGTKEQPIVFTSGKTVGSRVRGDWGGMLLIGNAHTNTANGVRQYEALPSDPLTLYGGGTNFNDADNSGTLRYVRIEYAGYNFLPDQEINGLTFAGVGNGTHADYIQVSYANDDSYEWFGGALNHKYLIAFAGTDDDFDMDEGYNGKCQYLLGVRNPGVFETSPTGTSNGLEHDNNTGLGTAGQVTPGVNAPEPRTAPIISNLTLLGPIRAGENRNALSTTARARFGRALEMRTNVSTSIFNSLIGGYPEGFRMVHPNANITPSVQDRALNDEMSMRTNVLSAAIVTDVLWSSTNPPASSGPFTTSSLAGWWFAGPQAFPAPSNDTANTIAKFGINSPSYTGNAGGALSQINFSGVNFTLNGNSSYAVNSRFNHPKTPTVPQPSISVNPTSLPVFNQVIGEPALIRAVYVNGANLTGNITITAPAGFEVSFTRASGYAASINRNNPVTITDSVFIRFTRTTVGSNSGFVRIASSATTDFAPINIFVNGNATAPASPLMSVSKAVLSFTSPVGIASAEQSLLVSGKFLTANVVLTAPAGVEVSTTSGSGYAASVSLTPNNGEVSAMVYARYTPSSTTTLNDSIDITSTGVDNVFIRITGSTPVATLTSSPSAYPEWQIVTGDSSIVYPITVGGTNLTDSVTITAPNANFQLSTDSAFTTPVQVIYLNTTEAATLASTKVYVRFRGTTSNGNVNIVSVGATSRTVAVAGRALAANARRINVRSTSSSFSFTTTFGTPSSSQQISINAANLTDTIGIGFTVPGFEVSANNTTWSPTLRLDTTAGGVVAATVWVRYNPSIVGATGAQQMTITSPSANTLTYAVSGQSTPDVVVSPMQLPMFATVLGKASYSIPVTVSGSRLLNDIVLTPTAGFEVSLDSLTGFSATTTITKSGTTVAATKVYVRFKPTTAGNAPSNSALNVSTQSGPGAIITLNGYAVLPPTPVIDLAVASLPAFITNTPGATAGRSFIVNASNLTDSLRFSVGGDFELSNDSVNYKKNWVIAADANGRIANLKLFCRFNRTTSGVVSDTIVITSTGAITGKIAVNGTNNTAVTEVKNIADFSMYPNPANNELNMEFELNRAADVTISIVDITGKVAKDVAAENFNMGYNKVQADIRDLQNGFYFVRIQSLNTNKTVRLLIAH